jgi:hypothetical protein
VAYPLKIGLQLHHPGARVPGPGVPRARVPGPGVPGHCGKQQRQGKCRHNEGESQECCRCCLFDQLNTTSGRYFSGPGWGHRIENPQKDVIVGSSAAPQRWLGCRRTKRSFGRGAEEPKAARARTCSARSAAHSA